LKRRESNQAAQRDFTSVVSSVMGKKTLVVDQRWDKIGMSSMVEVELRQQLCRRYKVTLPENFLEIFPTPSQLQAYLEAAEGAPLPKELTVLKLLDSRIQQNNIESDSNDLDGGDDENQSTEKSKSNRPVVNLMLQIIGIVGIVLLFSLPIVPAYEIYNIHLLHPMVVR